MGTQAEPAWTATGWHPSANGLKQASIFLCISNKLRNNMRKKKQKKKEKKKGNYKPKNELGVRGRAIISCSCR